MRRRCTLGASSEPYHRGPALSPGGGRHHHAAARSARRGPYGDRASPARPCRRWCRRPAGRRRGRVRPGWVVALRAGGAAGHRAHHRHGYLPGPAAGSSARSASAAPSARAAPSPSSPPAGALPWPMSAPRHRTGASTSPSRSTATPTAPVPAHPRAVRSRKTRRCGGRWDRTGPPTTITVRVMARAELDPTPDGSGRRQRRPRVRRGLPGCPPRPVPDAGAPGDGTSTRRPGRCGHPRPLQRQGEGHHAPAHRNVDPDPALLPDADPGCRDLGAEVSSGSLVGGKVVDRPRGPTTRTAAGSTSPRPTSRTPASRFRARASRSPSPSRRERFTDPARDDRVHSEHGRPPGTAGTSDVPRAPDEGVAPAAPSGRPRAAAPGRPTRPGVRRGQVEALGRPGLPPLRRRVTWAPRRQRLLPAPGLWTGVPRREAERRQATKRASAMARGGVSNEPAQSG